MKTVTSKAFHMGIFFKQEMAQEFNGIMKGNEDVEGCVTNDQDMKYEKQGQPLPRRVPPTDVVTDEHF